jgi:hypothetical protein
MNEPFYQGAALIATPRRFWPTAGRGYSVDTLARASVGLPVSANASIRSTVERAAYAPGGGLAGIPFGRIMRSGALSPLERRGWPML